MLHLRLCNFNGNKINNIPEKKLIDIVQDFFFFLRDLLRYDIQEELMLDKNFYKLFKVVGFFYQCF